MGAMPGNLNPSGEARSPVLKGGEVHLPLLRREAGTVLASSNVQLIDRTNVRIRH